MQGFWTVLPMAVVMSAGPQIVTATFLATSEGARRNSLAFLGGVATATTISVTVFFLIGSGIAVKEGGGKDWLDWVIIGLLVILLIRVYVKRNETEPPKWMGKLEHANPRFAVTIGFLLYLLMPTDLIAVATVGAYIAHRGEPWWHTLGFVVLTILIAGLPFILLLAMGRRAESVLPKVREWMSTNSWIVNEAVLLFFLAMALF
jgi:hypothetical protein